MMRPVRAALRFWRYLYGENPLHLLAMVGCFALVGYVVSFVYPGPEDLALLIWFAGAVLLHDLVLYPLYALADQPLVIGRWARRKVLPRHPPLVPAINHIRVPVLGSAVLGLIYFPTITQRGEEAFRFTSGLGMAGIYQHWLLITGVLFLGSAVIYALRLGAAAGKGVMRRRRAVAVLGAPVAAGGSTASVAAPPEAPAPDESSSEDPAPEDPAPENSAPENSVPQETGPREAGPREAGPAHSSPEDSVPEESAPAIDNPGDEESVYAESTREAPDSEPLEPGSETGPGHRSDGSEGERS